ncbi:MAG: acyltransferase family protein [Labilithrix sp.]|nr:acyltransferase family protein [Labilithrix sp.]
MPAEAAGYDTGVDSVPPASPPASPDTRRDGKRPRARALAPEPAVVAQIRELEAQLDRLIDEASRNDLSSLVDDDDDIEDGVTVAGASARAVVDGFDAEATLPAGRASDPLPEPRDARPAVPAAPESVFDTARELLSTDFYLRKWGRLAMRGRSEEVDDFGLDPIYDAKLRPMLDFLYGKYFRVETSGIDNVPTRGRCLLVANHSGTLPLDGVMIKTAVKREHAAARDVRWLTEDFIYHFPFLGGAMNRLGAVRACQENAERLLAKEQLVAVFPEGVKGIGKLFSERYRLQRFGRGGFIKLCLRTSTPIVPVAVMGAEETNPMLFRIEHLSKALGLPYVPVTPTFPALGPLGLLPAPTKWRILFGEPLDLSAHGPEAADDEILVGKLAERVRAAIQGMLDRAVGSRKSVFFG